MNAATIVKTLKAKGQALTLTRVSPGTVDPVAGSIGTPVTQTWTVYGIETAPSVKDVMSMTQGTLIQSGDRLAIISADQTAPLPGDSLTIGGVVWNVVAVNAVNPAGTAYIYKLHVRNG
jgi:hypothetical protein